uniref:Uncharacterized protein n=1 Tax=Zea mays TaxID=4577 RepID=A0A804LZQ7_MAIZE
MRSPVAEVGPKLGLCTGEKMEARRVTPSRCACHQGMASHLVTQEQLDCAKEAIKSTVLMNLESRAKVTCLCLVIML